MTKRFLILTLFVFCIPFEISAEDASIEVGGSFTFFTRGSKGTNLSSAFNFDFYLNKHYYVGSVFEFMFANGRNISEIGLASGVMNGFVFPLSDIVAISTGFGAAYILAKASYDKYQSYPYYYDSEAIRHAYAIPAYIGLKIKVAESAFIHIRPGYQYTQIIGTYKAYIHSFNVGIGFSVAIWNQNK